MSSAKPKLAWVIDSVVLAVHYRHDGRDYGDDYTVKVPGEIDVQRARRIIEELRRRFGDVLRPQEELDYIERLLKDY